MRKITNRICCKANHFIHRARIVLGALLLAALTLIFNDTVIPRITREIEGLFG